jgi:hypothetical protein
LSLARESPAFAAVVGLPLVSFLILVTTAMTFSSTPNRPAPDDADPAAAVQRLSHLLGGAGFFLGVAVAWLALPPLLEALGLPGLADAFAWGLLAALPVGGARLAVLAYRLTAASAPACLVLPAVGFGLPAAYRLGLARAMPGLWPADPAVRMAFVAFGVAVLGLALQTGLLLAHGRAPSRRWLGRNGHGAALAYLQAAIVAAALAWFAVAMA